MKETIIRMEVKSMEEAEVAVKAFDNMIKSLSLPGSSKLEIVIKN